MDSKANVYYHFGDHDDPLVIFGFVSSSWKPDIHPPGLRIKMDGLDKILTPITNFKYSLDDDKYVLIDDIVLLLDKNKYDVTPALPFISDSTKNKINKVNNV
jgi:hypothetical protein